MGFHLAFGVVGGAEDWLAVIDLAVRVGFALVGFLSDAQRQM